MHIIHRQFRLRLAVAVAVAVAGSVFLPTLANEAAAAVAADQDAIPEIVVTAQKRGQNINDVGMSIDAFSGDQLADRGVIDTSDLGKVVAGFSVATTGDATPVYTIRGIGFQESSLGASPAVSIYVDEVPLPFPVESQAAALDLQRVEVLKGPQGTLFGENATGGLVNYIANKPTASFQAGVDVSYERFNTADVQGFVSGPVSNTVNARFVVRTVQGGDWQQNYINGDTLGTTNLTEGRLLLDWQAADPLKVSVNLNGWVDRSDTQATQFIYEFQKGPAAVPPGLIAFPVAPENARAASWNTGESYRRDNTFYQSTIRLDLKVADTMTVSSLSSYERYSRYQPMDADGTTYQNFSLLNTGSISTIFQELRLAGDFNRGHWIVGVNYESDSIYDFQLEQYRDSSESAVFGFPLSQNTNFSSQSAKTYAAFANIDYEIADTLTLQGGARYTQANRSLNGACAGDTGNGQASAVFEALQGAIKGAGNVIPIPPGGCFSLNSEFNPTEATGRLDQNNVSWRVGLNWNFIPDSLLYANISKGYKAGSFPTLPASTTAQYTPVTQESVLAYEAGFKSSMLDRTLEVNGALFYYEYMDKQIRGAEEDPVFGSLPRLVNIPKSHVEGAEVDVAWSPMRGLTFSPNVTYIHSRIDGNFANYTPLGQTGNFTGEAFPYTPQIQANLDVQYKWGVFSGYSAFVGANGSHESSTNGGFGETPQYFIKGYSLLDLRAGIESADDNWRLAIWGRNVTNEYYWTGVNLGIDTVSRYAGRPATFGFTFSYRYR